MFAQTSDFAVWYWCLLPKMALPYLCLVECTNPISLEMAMAAYRQIAEVQQSQGSEEQQEPPQKKLRLGTTEAVATANPWRCSEREKNRRLREEAERCWDKAFHDATRQWHVLEMGNKHNKLVQEYNKLVQEHNPLLEEQNKLVQEHNKLAQEYNKLVQEYRELRESECRRLHEEAERDLKEKSANDSAECSLKGSAASAHAKMMNATSVSHASRTVDSDMQRMCLCRSCGGWIIFPRSSFPAGQPTEKPYEGHDPYGVEPSHSSAGPAETSF